MTSPLNLKSGFILDIFPYTNASSVLWRWIWPIYKFLNAAKNPFITITLFSSIDHCLCCKEVWKGSKYCHWDYSQSSKNQICYFLLQSPCSTCSQNTRSLFFFALLSGSSPKYMSKCKLQLGAYADHQTCIVNIPSRSVISQCSFSYQSPSNWNLLTFKLGYKETMVTFKWAPKTFFLSAKSNRLVCQCLSCINFYSYLLYILSYWVWIYFIVLSLVLLYA